VASTVTYLPPVHCCICIQLGERVAATATVMSERRDYQACDEHAESITLRGITAAIRTAKRNPTKGAV
jgi:hypothetical protein